MWIGQFPVPLQQYLTRPFDPGDICALDPDGALTAQDIHLLGSPRELTQSFTSYNDDGTVELTTRAVTDFSRTGQILSSIDTAAGNGIISKAAFHYDQAARLTEIDAANPKLQSTCVAKFYYDEAGRLFKIASTSSDGTDRTVNIAYGPNGRPKEAIQRRSTGKAEWRLAYSYASGSVTIERYFSDDLSEGNEKATFHLDASNRPGQIDHESHDSSFGDKTGRYVYTYLSNGISLMHAEISDRGKPCIFDFSLHRNGEVDLKSIKALGETDLSCNAPTASVGILQTYFDRRGNKVIDREGNEVQELGRAVDRWEYVTMNAITYY